MTAADARRVVADLGLDAAAIVADAPTLDAHRLEALRAIFTLNAPSGPARHEPAGLTDHGYRRDLRAE